MNDEMKTTKRCIVLGVGKPYDFIPEGETESITGCKLAYLGTTDLTTPVFDDESGLHGIMPQKIRMDPEFYEATMNVSMPCQADITFSIVLGGSGAKVKISDISFIEAEKKGGK